MLASQLFDLTGEVALVTGASSGLGARFAEVLAANGAKVVLAARRRDRLEALAGKIGPNAIPVELDVSKPGGIAGAFTAAEKAFGPVTILLNNAGVSGHGPFTGITAEEWAQTRTVNLDAVWFMAQEGARRMIAAGAEGTIINISSILGLRVTPNSAAYCVTKAAVAQMTAAMALDLARHKIRVNAIAPGYITTELTEDFLNSERSAATRKAIPQRRTGDASDLDGPLLLLASKKASGFMTGSTIVADGGHMWSFQ
ncbi:SDR family oxidoreductase [soil metagenome]